MSISFPFVLFKWSFTLWVYSHLMLSSFRSLNLKNSSCFNGAFLLLLFNRHGGKFILHIIGNGHYFIASVDSNVLNYL